MMNNNKPITIIIYVNLHITPNLNSRCFVKDDNPSDRDDEYDSSSSELTPTFIIIFLYPLVMHVSSSIPISDVLFKPKKKKNFFFWEGQNPLLLRGNLHTYFLDMN
jgi:hypothetical protein